MRLFIDLLFLQQQAAHFKIKKISPRKGSKAKTAWPTVMGDRSTKFERASETVLCPYVRVTFTEGRGA